MIDDDDPVARWYKRKLLEDMSKNARQPVLAEMARDILAGRLTTRQAMASDAYMAALGTAARPALAQYKEMSPAELDAAEREGRAAAGQLTAADEQRARARRPPVDDEPTGSIMIRPSRGPAGPVAAGPVLPRSMRERANRRRGQGLSRN